MRQKLYKLALIMLLFVLLTIAVALGYSIGPGSRLNGYVIDMYLRNYESTRETSLF